MKLPWIMGLFCVACSAGTGMQEKGPLSPADLARRWTKLYVPNAAGAPEVVRTEADFFALSGESLGEGKVWTGSRTYLYRSDDGVRWRFVPLHPTPGGLGLRGFAHGGGRFVSALSAPPGSSQIWTSTDAGSWSVLPIAVAGANFHRVVFAKDRFFVLGNSSQLATSEDGKEWKLLTLSTLQLFGLAYGNGRFVVVGSGPIQYSDDGLNWRAVALDCALPGACISDPGGGVHQHSHEDVVFAEGFYVDQLFSRDGEHWQPHSHPSAEIYEGGYLFGRTNPQSRWGLPPYEGDRDDLLAWKPGGHTATIQLDILPASAEFGERKGRPPPNTIETRSLGAANCLTRRCVVIKNAIYLIP